MNEAEARVSLRVVGAAIAAVATAFVLLVGGWLVGTHVHFAGTNSVAPKYNLPPLKPGDTLCLRSLEIPANANGIRLRMIGARTPAPVTMRLTAGTRQLVAGTVAPIGRFGGDFHFAAFGRDTAAVACLRSTRVVEASSGMPASTTAPQGNAYLDGKLVGRASIWYLRPGERLISAIPAGAHHASLFRPGFVGAWTYWLLAALVFLCWAAGLRLVLGGAR